jgi:hypothetical protein
MTAKPTTPAALTWSGVTARRMVRHALTEPATDLGLLKDCGMDQQVPARLATSRTTRLRMGRCSGTAAA